MCMRQTILLHQEVYIYARTISVVYHSLIVVNQNFSYLGWKEFKLWELFFDIKVIVKLISKGLYPNNLRSKGRYPFILIVYQIFVLALDLPYYIGECLNITC